MAINVPLNAQLQNATQLQQQVQNAVNAVRINLGGPNGARALSSLSQPLGRLTGQADEFTKSLDAANARVLAFGASVGVVNAVSNAFKALVNSTIEVEKALTEISVVGDQFNGKTKQLSQGLFDIAKNTGQSFAEVSRAALEFSRQGLNLEETLARTKDALILTRTTGLDAAKSVEGLSAAVSAFAKAGLSTAQVINKLGAVDKAFKVSSADLIQAFERTGAVAQQAGVSFDELAGIVTALQSDTSRGGAVIGNALKTIFSRLQDTSTLTQLQNLGIAVEDLQGNVLPARQILQNLANDIQGLSKLTQAGIFKDVAGTFQLNQLVSLVNDLGRAQGIAAKATEISSGATNEAYIANEKLNQSLDAILNKLATTGKQFGALLGEIGFSDNLKGILDGINNFIEQVTDVLQGDDLGSKFAKGIVKGIGSVLSGPGFMVFLAIVVKLSYDLLKFGAQSLKTFFNIGKAANDQKQIQESIVQVLLRNQNVLNQILSTQGGQNAQAQAFLGILNQQAAAMQTIQGLAGNIAGTVYGAGYRQTGQGLARRSAGGYLPAQEAADVRRGVGGASPNSKVVAIPNFAFGGGKRGTMIANTSEYIVPNYAGGGSAIFNQDMVKTMGLPAGAKKISASGGFVPNFANIKRVGEDVSFSNYRVDELLSKTKNRFERIDKVDNYDKFNGFIDIIRLGKTSAEYTKDSQALIDTFWKDPEKFKNVINSFSKQGIDQQYINRVKANYESKKFLPLQSGIKGILGELDASQLSGKALTQNNAYFDLIGGGEVRTRDFTNLSDLVKKSANNKLSFSSINYKGNKKEDDIALPKLPVYLPLESYKISKKTGEKRKTGALNLNASTGYIPNFANYIYDSDKIQSAQRERILQSILSSTKRKNLLVGPAGSGKSTAAAGLGTFIKSIDDLRMASSFTILSSSGLSSKGGFTESFQNILSAVNRSGGKTTYLGTTNEELMRRRGSRTLSEGDVRSAGELSGTAYAPLNQSAFIKQLKKESRDFQLQKSAKSSFSNDQLAVLGLYGQTGGNIDGSKIYTLSSQQPNITRDIKKEYEARVKTFVRGYSQELANKIGIKRSPKEVKKSIQQSDSVSGFIFEDVLNQLAGKEFDTSSLSGGARVDFKMTPNLRAVFGTGSETFAEAKLNPYTSDAQSSVRSKQAAMLSGAASLPKQQSSSSFSQLRQRWINYKNRANKKGGFEEFQAIVKAAGVTGTSKDTLNKQLNAYFGTAAAGYIPNFADLDGDGVVTQRDGFYQRLKSAAKKYSKNPSVDFILNQVLQSMLGLPEGVDVMETVKACDKALKALKPEDELNKILREKSAAKKAQKRQSFLKGYYNSSAGYVPNFAASALQEAIAREKSAGLSDSQIYVDQNPSLKSPQNPMGLMVANTRDEPFGGIQGISRARRQGMNPKLYGAANGFVPNYAAREALKQQSFTISIKNGEAFDKKLQELADEVSKQTKSFKAASKELETFVSTLKTVGTKKKPSAPYDAPTQQALLALGKEKLEASKPAKEPKSVGDSLAKVVGIQSAFIGLQSVVESMADEGSDFSKNVKAFGGIISGLYSGLTLFTAGLGPIGIALGAVTVGFNLLRDVFPDALQSIKESFGGLSLEGQKASKALDEFAEKVARGGVSVEEALKSAEQQASEAILRTKAKEKGIKTETDAGELKDPAKLARELVIQTARRNQANLGLGTDIYKKVGTQTQVIGSETGRFGKMTVEKDVFNQAPALFSDLNESTQNVIFDIFEETVSVNKAGLVALGNKIKKEIPGFQAKDFQDLVDEGAVQKYRSELLTAIIRVPQAQQQISDIIQKATTGQGENRKIDEKVVVEELKQSGLFNLVKDYLKEIIPAAAAIEDASEVNIFRANVDDLIRSYSDFSSTLNRAINNRISLLEGLTSSQTFTGLSEQQQFQTKAALDRFKSNTSFQSQKRALTEEVQSTLSATLKDLRATESIPVEKINELANELSTLDVGNLESFLNKFGSAVKLSKDKLTQFNNDVSKFNNKSKDLFANREVEVQLLNFSIQERQTELNAIKTFYNGLDKFNSGIREKEREIRNLDFKKTLSEQTAQYERELAQLTSTSPEELRTRTQAADTKATKDQASIERKQNEIRAKIEAEQAINTVENIKALNRNTEVLQKLLTQFSIKNVQEQIDSIIKGAAGRALTPDEGAQLSTLVSQKLALQNPPQSTGDIKDLSSLAFPASRTEIDKKIGELGVLTDEEKAKYKGIFNRYFDQIEIGIDAEKARNDASKNQQGLDDQLFKIKQSYVDDIANELKSLRESQYSPKSIGQFAATERQIKMAQRKESLKNNPEKVREYLSSFGYGFDEAMSKVEERTLDFRNQLGKEIPDLFSQNLAQGLNDAISGAKTLKEALMDAATSFFQEITKRNISNLADLVTGGIGNLVGGFIPQTKASGGLIKGGSGTKDDVPAMLMGGEYVVKKSAVNKYGKGFFDAINSGRMRGYATGGMVDPQTFPTQTGRGGFFTPGDYGQGAITGKNELLTFATQSFTGGQYDYMGGFGMGGATVSLEPESARLSAFGRENSPMFERVQQSKDEAFRVYLEGLQKEKEYAELLDQIAKNEKARKKQLQMAIISAVVSSALSYAGNKYFPQGSKEYSVLNNPGFRITRTTSQRPSQPMISGSGAASYLRVSNNTSALPLPTSTSGSSSTPMLLPQRTAGGLISGGSNIRDDVPAMLTGGEFVLNNRATQRIGLQNLNRLNSGAPVSSEGSSPEMTQTLIAKLDELIQTTANSSKENVVVNVSTNEAGGQTTENPTGTERDLQKKIRQAVLDVIAQEKRLGGSLEKSR